MRLNLSEEEQAASAFKIIKRNGLILTSDILAVMTGSASALHIKGAATKETCERIARNFNENEGVMIRKDGVDGKYIGASHFKKGCQAYFEESSRNKRYIDALLGDVLDPVRAAFSLLDMTLSERGGSIRLASSSVGKANYCRALCWTGQNAYALEPHDDLAQVLHAGEGYEFVDVAKHQVVAVNFYPSMPEQGGDLRIWNYKPTPEEKEVHGLAKTGYPYTPDLLDEKEYWDLGVNAGDLVLLNGAFVHAVTKQSRQGTRLLLHAFMGFVDETHAVWWT